MGTLRLLILIGGILFLVPMAADAKIFAFTDSRGEVHISNQKAESPPPQRIRSIPPTTPLEEKEPSGKSVPLRLPPGQQNAFCQENSGQFKPAVYVDNSPPQIHPTRVIRRTLPVARTGAQPQSNPAKQPTAAGPVRETIRVSQKEQGVLVITNLPEKDADAPVMAASGKTRRIASPFPDSPVFSEDSPLYGQIIPAAYNHSPDPVRSFSTAVEEGPIRRHRDKKGAWRISNVVPILGKTSRPAVAVLPPCLEAIAAPPLTMSQPPTPQSTAQFRTVAVRRDKGGRLRIYTKEPEPPLLASLPHPPAMDRIDPALAPLVTEAANTYRLPPSLILSVIRMESNFVPWAVSPKGAMGLMQLMPGTAADLGVKDPFCPRENIMGGSRYLRQLINCFDGSLPLAVAAYNAGPHRVVEAGHQVPEIRETKQFVNKVLGMHAELEKKPFILTPP
jgi:hypothetical protein